MRRLGKANRLLAAGFALQNRHRAKPVSERERSGVERALRSKSMPSEAREREGAKRSRARTAVYIKRTEQTALPMAGLFMIENEHE